MQANADHLRLTPAKFLFLERDVRLFIGELRRHNIPQAKEFELNLQRRWSDSS